MELTSQEIQSKKILYIFLAISLSIHLIFSIVHLGGFDLSKIQPKEEKKIIVKLLSDIKKNKGKQIAQTEKSTIEKAKDARFFSDKNNFHARETKSANNGKFQAAGQGIRTAQANKNQEVVKKVDDKKIKNIKFSDLAFKSSPSEFVKKKKQVAKVRQVKKGLKNGKKTGIGLGQTNDFLEDIPLGDFTKLNTQEYEFYGFYHRIRQKLEQFWGSNIQETADKIYKQGRSIASDTNLITGLIINLNHKGEIIEILIKSTSGMKELDDAAIQSFNEAGPFPNPPKGMLKNGKATIEWGFVVNT